MKEKKRRQTYLEEMGRMADPKVVREITNEIVSSWKFKKTPPQNPTILYLGGFQGSGKTSVLDTVAKDIDVAVISPDEIRYKLIHEKEWDKKTEKFSHTVNATRNELIRRALTLGHHIVIDQLTTEKRIKLIKNILEETNSNYKLITIFLDAPLKVLQNRLETRKEKPGRYTGTLDELNQSIMLYGNQNLGLYDRVLYSDRLGLEQIAQTIKSIFIKNIPN